MPGTLFLLPVPLADGEPRDVMPEPVLRIARELGYFLAENARSARAFLKAAGHPGPMQQIRIVEIGTDPLAAQAESWLAPLLNSECDAALVSECGCPCIADPGASIVERAHALELEVRPLVGPSSILLALMASGMNGQRFRFLGYLPQDAAALSASVQQLERDAGRGETQIFIETPYRAQRLFSWLLANCAPDMRLCVAANLGLPSAFVRSMSVVRWRAMEASKRPDLQRRPAVFLLHREAAAGRR